MASDTKFEAFKLSDKFLSQYLFNIIYRHMAIGILYTAIIFPTRQDLL